MSPLFPIYLISIIFATLFGIVIGSFLNVVIYRVPEGRTISKGHSMCMSCGHVLGALDLVPLFSWLFLRGKCRYCKAPVPSRYAKIESLTGLVFCITSIFHKEDLLYFLNPYLTPAFIYYCLFVISAAATISSMMIYYDTSKAFWKIGLFTVIPGFLATFADGLYTFDFNYISSLISALVSLVCVAAFIGICKLASALFKNNYSKTDFSLDFVFAGIMQFGFYLWIGSGYYRYITYFAYAICYAILRQALKNKPADKYVGIIASSAVVILLCLGYIYIVL